MWTHKNSNLSSKNNPRQIEVPLKGQLFDR